MCIDGQNWNSETRFDDIKSNFIKYVNILPADNSRDYEEGKVETFSKWKYAKLGISKLGVALFSSSSDMNNYTILPDEYENQYFYTYILNLYKKIYLKKLQNQFKKGNKLKETRKEFVEFTKTLWIQEITEDETGTLLNHKMQDAFELEKLYNEVKNKYDVMYKELNIERNSKSIALIAIILGASLALNIINFAVLIKRAI